MMQHLVLLYNYTNSKILILISPPFPQRIHPYLLPHHLLKSSPPPLLLQSAHSNYPPSLPFAALLAILIMYKVFAELFLKL